MIIGSARVNEVLTADTSGISDEDGIDNVLFEYQWMRTGVELTNIPGATSSTYQITEDDLGQAILVTVSFLDDRGYPESPTPSIQTHGVAAADVLVTNGFRSGHSAIISSTSPRFAQRFTTGESLPGYKITSAGIVFAAIQNPATVGGDLTATINEVSNGLPGSVVCTLEDPASFSGSGLHTFRPPETGGTCPALAPATTYFIVLSRENNNGGGITLVTTVNLGQNSGSAEGWTIGNHAHEYTDSSSTWAEVSTSSNLIIEVRGGESDEIIVPAYWSLTPKRFYEGDKFRLIFLTETGHSPTSTDIEDYNAYVQAQAAAGHADIQDYSSWFRVLGSTWQTNAIDNTETNFTVSEKGVPIYWMNGAKVADHYEDLYDESWDDEANPTNRNGNVTTPGYVWTGSTSAGTRSALTSFPTALGNTQIRLGRLNAQNDNPVASAGDAAQASGLYPYYALSRIFVSSNPLPNATGAPTVTGIPKVNETLTAETSAINDVDGLTSVNYEYQWVRSDGNLDEPIVGATGSTYVLTGEDVDHQIKVSVTFKDDATNDEGPLKSAFSDSIAPANMLVQNTRQNPSTITAQLTSASPKRAQAFTTGAESDGYSLNSIEILFQEFNNTATASGQIAITLNSEDSGAPDEALCTLTNPETFSSAGLHDFSGSHE